MVDYALEDAVDFAHGVVATELQRAFDRAVEGVHDGSIPVPEDMTAEEAVEQFVFAHLWEDVAADDGFMRKQVRYAAADEFIRREEDES